MKIIVIGLGSMGKRRIRLLKEKKGMTLIGVDNQTLRRKEAEEMFDIDCYSNIDDAVASGGVEAAVISTSPLSHSHIIRECLKKNLHVFTEINLVQDGYVENIKTAKEKGKVLFLSSTFLYRKETQIIIDEVKKAECPLNYIYHVGQYLPDWHPWEHYNNYFIGNPKTNGCREIMAIDLPWLISAFGEVKNVYSVKSKNTKLNINYNDNYLITFEHENGSKGVFAVDVITRKPCRRLDIYGEQFQISWDGTADSLYKYNIDLKKNEKIEINDASEHIAGYADFVTENPYREELNAFFKNISDNNFAPAWDFERDKAVLDLIDRIEI